MNALIKLKLLVITIFVSSSIFAQSVSINLAQQYYAEGELEKALDTYEKLAKKSTNWQIIHTQYFALLIQLNQFQKATKYIDKAIKSYPKNPNYKIDKGKLIKRL